MRGGPSRGDTATGVFPPTPLPPPTPHPTTQLSAPLAAARGLGSVLGDALSRLARGLFPPPWGLPREAGRGEPNPRDAGLAIGGGSKLRPGSGEGGAGGSEERGRERWLAIPAPKLAELPKFPSPGGGVSGSDAYAAMLKTGAARKTTGAAWAPEKWYINFFR